MDGRLVRVDRLIKRIYVEEGAERYGMTSRVLKVLKGIPCERVAPNDIERSKHVEMDKKSLRLLAFQGESLKPCPGTKGYICCGYQILHLGTNCPLDCHYCILQAYFNQPSLRMFVNLEDKLEQIDRTLGSQPERIFRIGTGEFTDSLALDPILGWTEVLLPFFSSRKNTVLELKTKTDQIEALLSSRWRERIIVSWSLNSPDIAAREETGTPGIRKRFEAARRCQKGGFVIGFHFDPLIRYDEWKDGYARTLEMMDRYIDPKGIIWVSLGAMRYVAALKPIIRRRHPGTHILDGEFVPGLDGKMRYFKPLRTEMYQFMGEKLKEWHRDLGVYLCMESHEIWEKGLGWSPGGTEGLSRYLDERVRKLFRE